MSSPPDVAVDLKQNPTIQRYLQIASSKIRSRNLRQQIEAEILSHLEACLQDHRDDSVSLEQAIQAALASLGDVQELRRGLFEANLPFYLRKRFYMPIVAVAASLGLFFLAVESYSHRAKLLLETRIAKVEASLDAFLADDRDITAKAIFENRVEGRDVGPVLNHQISWNMPDLNSAAPQITVPKDLAEKLSFLGDDWLVERAQIDESGVDLTWMEQLQDFDIWDLYRSGPAATFARNPDLNPFAVPTPNYVSMAGFAKLALLKGIKTGALTTAISRVEQLARLVYSNETFIGGLIAVSFLKANTEAYAFGRDHGLIDPEFHLHYSLGTLEKFERIMVARANYFDFANSHEVLASAFPVAANLRSSPGVCQALDEGLKAMTIYHQYFAGQFPYEESHQKNIAYIDTVIEASKSVCRISPARFFWSQRDRVPDLSKALSVSFDPIRDTVLEFASKIPYARRAVGIMLMAVARPVFSGY